MEAISEREEWRDIKGYEGQYQVSNLGRVKSLDRISAQNHHLKERIRKPETDKNGYKIVNLCKEGIVTLHKVHRLVGEAFIDNPDNKPQINHKDGCKCNNCVGNLEWVNSSENVIHAFRIGIKKPSRIGYFWEKNPNCKLTDAQCEEIRNLSKNTNMTGRELAYIYNVGTSQISRILKEEQRKKGSVKIGY